MLFDQLTAEEVDMMDSYRKCFAFNSESIYQSENYAPMSHILREWDFQKSQHLYKLLGNQLTVTKDLIYHKSDEELEEELSAMTTQYSTFGRCGRNGYEFSNAFQNFLWNGYRHYDFLTEEALSGLQRLFEDESLISNIYEGASFSINLPSGKPYKVNQGCKTIKALGKIADIFNLSGFEDFRICHSQILNQKNLGGKLTLSIHPMDYMTMSDNDCGWESCMSWSQEGGYRQGTVEMMNSPTVIVAYLASDIPMVISPYPYARSQSKYHWNNKKWRQLFIVDHDAIIGVKDYPYHNEDLTGEVLEWIRELAKTNLGWTYREKEFYSFGSKTVKVESFPEDRQEFFINCPTGEMYCDLGCLDRHWIALSDNLDPEHINVPQHHWDCRANLTITYSGNSECMICGNLDPELTDESTLACNDCQHRMKCDCCDEWIESENYYQIDGMILCESCYDYNVHECACCGEEHHVDNMIPVYILPHLSNAELEECKERYMNQRKTLNYRYFSSTYELNYERQCDVYPCDLDRPNFWLCNDVRYDNDKIQRWAKDNLIPGAKLSLRECEWSRVLCIYYDELTPEAQDEYVYGYKDAKDFNQKKMDSILAPLKLLEFL